MINLHLIQREAVNAFGGVLGKNITHYRTNCAPRFVSLAEFGLELIHCVFHLVLRLLGFLFGVLCLFVFGFGIALFVGNLPGHLGRILLGVALAFEL